MVNLGAIISWNNDAKTADNALQNLRKLPFHFGRSSVTNYRACSFPRKKCLVKESEIWDKERKRSTSAKPECVHAQKHQRPAVFPPAGEEGSLKQY